MADALPHWRDFVVPHQDIRENRVSEALFAVNLSRAIDREGPPEYRDPLLFFQRTHLTRTLRSLIVDVLRTLRGDTGLNSIIHLQTNFGGGKTHAELALYHLLTTPEVAAEVPALGDLLFENGFQSVEDTPRAAVAVLPCADLDAGGRETDEGLVIRTLWGEMAYRLGSAYRSGPELYNIVRDADQRRMSPGVIILRRLLNEAGPNLILIDELLHYIDKAAGERIGDSNLGTQTLAFLRELTEAVEAVDHSVLVASVTASNIEDLQILAGDTVQSTLAKMEDILRRVEDSRTPIEASEIFEIIRTRLFEDVDLNAAAAVAAAYHDLYKSDAWRDLLPQMSRDPGFENTLLRAYPFHPSIVNVLYERWGSRPQFQLTRGTLRFLSHLMAHLWQRDNLHIAPGSLIHLPDINLLDDDIRAETVRVAGSEWESVIGTDIASLESGKIAIAQRADQERGGLYRSLRLIEGIATSAFMYTHGGQQSKPTPYTDIRLAVIRPDLPAPDVHQAFEDCRAHLYYYYEEDGGVIFKTEPNPNKVLADARTEVTTDEARRQVETVVADVIGKGNGFNVSYYDFYQTSTREPGDVPDDVTLQLVVLPPKLSAARNKVSGRTVEVIRDITQNYGKKLRLNRNMVLFLLADSEAVASAIERAMDWRAAERVRSDRALMERFTELQQEFIRDKVTGAQNDTKDFVRKAYNTLVLPAGTNGQTVTHELFEFSYVPPSKKVLEQAWDELSNNGKLLRDFNPALFAERWASLWPRTATIITTQALLEKFTRQAESPILTSADVLRRTIGQGVERNLFAYGLLRDPELDKLDAASYERTYFGEFDARDIYSIELSNRTVLIRPEQLEAMFPAITKEEVAMLLTGPHQTVQQVFDTARRNPTVQGRVDQTAFFAAVADGVRAGLFGYTENRNEPVRRGQDAQVTPGHVRFSALLVGEDTPLPITAGELAQLVPSDGRISTAELYQSAVTQYGENRVTEQAFVASLQRCLDDERFGYAPSEGEPLRIGPQAVEWDGYVGQPEPLAPDTRVITLSGTISPADFANIVRSVIALSKLGNTSLQLGLRLELTGSTNDHAINTALNELRRQVSGLKVDDVRG
ncbi:MAG: DUF499 domain-containing protein [Anaerolineae bacterium]|nr:DUF499 domain-containing protein [Anaerolineae bacterium]